MNRRACSLAAVAFAVAVIPAAAFVLSISITHVTALGFGQVISTGTPGTVTVAPAGTRSASGGAALGNSMGVSAATFLVTGDPLTTYSITLPSSATLSGGASSMTVDHFTSSPSGAGNLTVGTQLLSVGADLQVGGSQPSASYAGTYDISVAYN